MMFYSLKCIILITQTGWHDLIAIYSHYKLVLILQNPLTVTTDYKEKGKEQNLILITEDIFSHI